MEDRSRYIVELVAEEQQFGAGTKKAQDDLRKLGAEAAKLDRARLNSLKAQAAAEERLRRFNRLSETQKLVVLEERRLNLAKQLAYAEERGSSRQAAIIRNRLSGIDAMAAGIGAGGGSAGRGGRERKSGSPVMRMAGAGMASLGLGGLGGQDMGAGGLGGVVAMVMAIGRTIHAVFSEAYERSQAAQAAVEERKKLMEVSEGATEGLASLGVAIATLWAGVKKVLGEIWGATANVAQGAIGLGASALGNAAKGVGLTKAGEWLSSHGERMSWESVGNRPKWLGGMGGVDAQAGAMADKRRAELDSDTAKRKEKAADKSEKEADKARRDRERAEVTRFRGALQDRAQGLRSDISGVNSMFSTLRSGSSSGMYVAAGERDLNAKLLTIQSRMLDELKREVSATNRLIEAVRENGGGI